jgi:transposase-like protein
MNKEDAKIVCNICGSDQVDTVKNPVSISIPLGEDAVYEQVITVCKTCGEEIDITDEGNRNKAISTSEKKALEAIIQFIVDQGYSLANIERALDLPQRTISRWKSGQEPSSAGLALLRFIRVFPWLLSVAEKNYDISFSRQILMHSAISEFENYRQGICTAENPNKALRYIWGTKTDKEENVFIMAGVTTNIQPIETFGTSTPEEVEECNYATS